MYLSATRVKNDKNKNGKSDRKILIHITTKPATNNGKATTGKDAKKVANGQKKSGRVQSASISLPIRDEANQTVIQLKKPITIGEWRIKGITKVPVAKNSTPADAMAKAIKTAVGGTSPDSPTKQLPPRPMPQIRRTVRNPITNRVYSYSVSIPDYVAEEDEDALNEEDDDECKNKASDDDEDDDLALFSSSAPTSSSMPNFSAYRSSQSSPVRSLPSSPTGRNTLITATSKVVSPTSSPVDLESSPESPSPSACELHDHSATPCTSKTSREYIEQLRKFINHLKILRIGGNHGKQSKKGRNTSKSESNDIPSRSSPDEAQPLSSSCGESEKRTRTDTLEDSNQL